MIAGVVLKPADPAGEDEYLGEYKFVALPCEGSELTVFLAGQPTTVITRRVVQYPKLVGDDAEPGVAIVVSLQAI